MVESESNSHIVYDKALVSVCGPAFAVRNLVPMPVPVINNKKGSDAFFCCPAHGGYWRAFHPASQPGRLSGYLADKENEYKESG